MENEKRIAAGGLPERLDIEEATIIPVPPNVRRRIISELLTNMPLDKILVPLANETERGIAENRDSVSSFIHKSVILPEKLIDEAIADHFRKFGK